MYCTTVRSISEIHPRHNIYSLLSRSSFLVNYCFCSSPSSSHLIQMSTAVQNYDMGVSSYSPEVAVGGGAKRLHIKLGLILRMFEQVEVGAARCRQVGHYHSRTFPTPATPFPPSFLISSPCPVVSLLSNRHDTLEMLLLRLLPHTLSHVPLLLTSPLRRKLKIRVHDTTMST
jgi:hypothetical protein